MNTQLKELEKLGKDVENFEKRLQKAFQVFRNEGEAMKKVEKRSISNPDVVGKPKVPIMKSSQSKPLHPKVSQKNCAVVEVKVKTNKRPGKSWKTKSGQNVVVYAKSLPTSKPPTQPYRNDRSKGHCCCPKSLKNNAAWGDILKQSVDKKHTSSGRGDSAVQRDSRNDSNDSVVGREIGESYVRTTSPLRAQHNNFKRSTSSEHTGSEHDDNGCGCNENLSGTKWHSLNNKNHKNKNAEDESTKSLVGTRSLEGTNFKENAPLKPIDSLHALVEQLRDKISATADASTRKLVQDMQSALNRLSKSTPSNSEASFKTTCSSKKTVGEKESANSRSKNNVEAENSSRIPPSELPKSSPSKESVTTPPKCIEPNTHGPHLGTTSQGNEDQQASWKNKPTNGAYELSSCVLEVADKLKLPAKLNIDSNSKNHYAPGCDEKLKAELEYLNKQLKLQLKSVEGITTKESEYKNLIANLIEKVDKLEVQVTEQSKLAQHFYAQSSSLLEQNSVIPKMQKSFEQLREQLSNMMHNYEKLKAEYCLMKLERDKFCTLNSEKERQIHRFKEEIMNIQSLVVQQMENVRKYEGYASASEKVDNILSMIDEQSTLIRSKIKGVKDLNGKLLTIPGSPISTISSAPSRPQSPFSPSVRINSPDEGNLVMETDTSQGKITDDA